ncbi:hypothetical protein BDA99DRAFT_609525 [Phascolomyces articulosus]|uniref:PH domain-containing protein n=1 Tax=Phascolomyces articulosus TaxID=60185 RepID=A0AAD5P9R9_9FUNG|nr:hypothetical protein BDA99DRAFT_609525 [Phascolomyces articulosus]
MSFADLQTGWLHKLSWLNIHRSWKRRYFVLHEKELRYYKHQGDIRPTGMIDLKHYNGITPCTTKQSPWSFRIESGCCYHASHILAAESEQERDEWIERLYPYIQKQHRLHHNCAGSNEQQKQQTITSMKNTKGEAEEGSVLDKWLERLDLQDDDNTTTTTMTNGTSASSPPSSSSKSTTHLISTSLPQNYVYNHSATTIGCFDHPPQHPFDSSLSTTSSILTTGSSTITASPSSTGEVATPPTTHNNNNNNNNTNSTSSKASMLANAFAISARSRLRRMTSSSTEQPQPPMPPPQQQPASPRTSNETMYSTGSTSHIIHNIGHPTPYSNETWSTSSGLDIFHFEDDIASTYNASVRRSSVTSTMTLPLITDASTKYYNHPHRSPPPPLPLLPSSHSAIENSDVPSFTAPPPQSPLPPPPRNHRRLSVNHPTSL